MKVRVNATYTASFVVEVEDDIPLSEALLGVYDLPESIRYPEKYKVQLTDWDVTHVNA